MERRCAAARSSARKQSETRGSRSVARSRKPLVRRSESLRRAGDAGFRADGRLGQRRIPWPFGFGMHQERGAAIELGADEIEAALGLLPVLDHDVFQLFVQEFFRGLFELRIDFHEIGQHAQRLRRPRPCLFRGPRRGASPIRWCRCGAPAPARAIPCARGSAKLRSSARRFRGAAPTALRAALAEIFLGAAALAGDGFELQLALRHASRKAACARFRGVRFRPQPPALRAWSARVSRSMPARYSSICAS